MGGSSHATSTIKYGTKDKPHLGSIDAQTSSLHLMSLTASLQFTSEGPKSSTLPTAMADVEDNLKEHSSKKADLSITTTTLSSSGSSSLARTKAINHLQLVDATTQTIE